MTTPAGLPPQPSPLLAAPGGVDSSTNTPGETHLTQAELNSVIPTAIAYWLAAGVSPEQLALLDGTGFAVTDLLDNALAVTSGHLMLFDSDAAGHGWFIDPTPQDNAEFTHVANASGTDLFTDPTQDAAGHMDLLTTVMHEMGHVVGLADLVGTADHTDLMYIDLVAGERRLPDAADVAKAVDTSNTVNVANDAKGTSLSSATASADTSGNGAMHTGQAENAPVVSNGPASSSTGNTAAHGDAFDFSSLFANPLQSEGPVAHLAQLHDNLGGALAMLQGNTAAAGAAHLPDVAPVEGAHTADVAGIPIDTVHHYVMMA